MLCSRNLLGIPLRKLGEDVKVETAACMNVRLYVCTSVYLYLSPSGCSFKVL